MWGSLNSPTFLSCFFPSTSRKDSPTTVLPVEVECLRRRLLGYLMSEVYPSPLFLFLRRYRGSRIDSSKPGSYNWWTWPETMVHPGRWRVRNLRPPLFVSPPSYTRWGPFGRYNPDDHLGVDSTTCTDDTLFCSTFLRISITPPTVVGSFTDPSQSLSMSREKGKVQLQVIFVRHTCYEGFLPLWFLSCHKNRSFYF